MNKQLCLFVLSVTAALSGSSQIIPFLTGTFQIKQYVSYGQVQQKDYKGTGAWEKFPCPNCPVIVLKSDSLRRINDVIKAVTTLREKKLTYLKTYAAYVLYTNADGIFSGQLKEFRPGEQVTLIYGNATDFKRPLQLKAKTDAGVYTQKQNK